MQVKSQHLEADMEQQNGSKLGKEHIKTVYCHPAYLTYMQSSCKMPGWMKQKLAPAQDCLTPAQENGLSSPSEFKHVLTI